MRFTTLCGGLLPDCFMVQFTIFLKGMSDARPQHWELHALLFTISVWVL